MRELEYFTIGPNYPTNPGTADGEVGSGHTFSVLWDTPFIVIATIAVVLLAVPVIYYTSYTLWNRWRNRGSPLLTAEETYRRWSSPEAQIRLLNRYNSVKLSTEVHDNEFIRTSESSENSNTSTPSSRSGSRRTIVGYFDNGVGEKGRSNPSQDADYKIVCLFRENPNPACRILFTSDVIPGVHV